MGTNTMDYEAANRRVKEVKSAKRSVETSIRMFGPANITSILDRDTFAKKLAIITTKLEMYMEKAEEVIEELDEVEKIKGETDGEYAIKIDEINSLTDDIFKKVNDNENEVKKRILEIIAESEDNTDNLELSKPSENTDNDIVPDISVDTKTPTAECETEEGINDQDIGEDLT